MAVGLGRRRADADGKRRGIEVTALDERVDDLLEAFVVQIELGVEVVLARCAPSDNAMRSRVVNGPWALSWRPNFMALS